MQTFSPPVIGDCGNSSTKTVKNESSNSNQSSSVIVVLVIFSSFLIVLLSIYISLPQLNDYDNKHLKIPWNIDEVRNLANILNAYKTDYYYQVFFGLSITYIFLQTFAIPGSIFLSILAGFLYPFYVALLLICLCSACGASLCFLVSQTVGKRILQKFLPDKIDNWSHQVHRHRNHLFNYVVFLRVTPFLPNWFINLVAPIVGVPLKAFALGTFVGVAPPSFIAIQAGRTLHTLSDEHQQFSATSILLLSFFAFLSLTPVLFQNRLKRKFD